MNPIPVGPFQASSKQGGKDELHSVNKTPAISFYSKDVFLDILELFRCPDLLPNLYFSGLAGWVNAGAGFVPRAVEMLSCGLE